VKANTGNKPRGRFERIWTIGAATLLFSRKFAPYIGFTYSSSFGQTATLARRVGEPTQVSTLVLGIWL
jgi:hypothetical protein